MVDRAGNSELEEFPGTQIQVLGTNPDRPEAGRIFVWTKMGWFERLSGQTGNVAFTPVAASEEELKELILRTGPGEDLHELGAKYRKQVSAEFREQSPSNLDSTDSSEESEDDQQYHQHD